LPSGPTFTCTGAIQASRLARKFQVFVEVKVEPFGLRSKVPMKFAVGSASKATRFQYSLGNTRAV
jgi:hypothetical protein